MLKKSFFTITFLEKAPFLSLIILPESHSIRQVLVILIMVIHIISKTFIFKNYLKQEIIELDISDPFPIFSSIQLTTEKNREDVIFLIKRF